VGDVRVISAGAARGLLTALDAALADRVQASIVVDYGPVGVVDEAVRSGASCDVVITSASRLGDLVADGLVVADSDVSLGSVPTALAVRAGGAVPPLADGADVRAALLAADAVYCPDTDLSTAGAHLRSVLEALAVTESVLPRLSVHSHGAAALQAMVAGSASSPVGVAQLTEVLATDGVVPVGALPAPYALATDYRAAVGVHAADPGRAGLLVQMLAGHGLARRAAGFQDPR